MKVGDRVILKQYPAWRGSIERVLVVNNSATYAVKWGQ